MLGAIPTDADAMLQWFLAILVALAVGGAATWLARGPLRRRDEDTAGLAALAAMSWRDFLKLVLEALSRRGFRHVAERGAVATEGDCTLVRNGDAWLLAAKHGRAFVLGRAAVDDLAASMAMADAAGGLLVTQGRIADDARRAARGRPIELLDGASLWPELRPLLPAAVVDPIAEAAAKRARERTWAGWLLALIAGVAVSILVPDPRPAPGAPAVPGAAAADPGAAAPVAPAVAATPDPATLPEQRQELAGAVATLPGVTRALWTSSSTLEVHVVDASGDPFTPVCGLVVRYPELAASRIQLTPPPGSGQAVRFRQCRSY